MKIKLGKNNSNHSIEGIHLVGMMIYDSTSDTFLCEYRSESACIYANETRILGGHVNHGESPEECYFREQSEETITIPIDPIRVCRTIDVVGKLPVVTDYFGCFDWKGTLQNPESKSMVWKRDSGSEIHPNDRFAMLTYKRLLS